MEKDNPPVVSVTGWSDSGKTTFSEQLIRELISRGLQVSALKSTHHDIIADRPGSDTDRFYSAGAKAVCLSAPGGRTVFYSSPLSSESELGEMFPDCDIIISEGYKSRNAFRIEVAGVIGDEGELKNPLSEADIVLSDNPKLGQYCSDCGAVFLKLSDVKKAADLIMKEFELK